jgi:hypothetical protein
MFHSCVLLLMSAHLVWHEFSLMKWSPEGKEHRWALLLVPREKLECCRGSLNLQMQSQSCGIARSEFPRSHQSCAGIGKGCGLCLLGLCNCGVLSGAFPMVNGWNKDLATMLSTVPRLGCYELSHRSCWESEGTGADLGLQTWVKPGFCTGGCTLEPVFWEGDPHQFPWHKHRWISGLWPW